MSYRQAGFKGLGDGFTMATTDAAHHAPPSSGAGLRPLPRLIFASRWLQLPLYLGLIVAQVVYVILFLKELYHLVGTASRSPSSRSCWSCWG